MKKILLLLIALPLFAFGQENNLYHIPDANFLAYLQNTYPEVILNDSLDVDAAEVIITQINCQSCEISSLDGVQFFDNLESILCPDNQLITLPEIPLNVTTIIVPGNNLIELPSLPEGLIHLLVSDNNLTSLPNLPSAVVYDGIFYFSNNPIECMNYNNVINYNTGFYFNNNNYYYYETLPYCSACLDENACNSTFDPEILSVDNTLCIYSTDLSDCATCSGETDGFGYIIENDSDNDGVCDEFETFGCVDSTACNYNAAATANQACEYSWYESDCATCSGEIDGTGVIISNDIDGDWLCDSEDILFGCTDELACNYNESSTINTDNSLCVNLVVDCDTCSGEQDGTGTVVDNDLDNDGLCDVEDTLIACTNSTACNYNASTTINSDNDLCTYTEGLCESCVDGLVVDNDIDDDGVCDDDEILGCCSPWADNYNSAATDCDDSCIREGCMVEIMFNYDSLATYDQGGCIQVIIGCMDSTYTEYNSVANTDNGSCLTLVVEGFIDWLYVEYNSDSNTDDSSCLTLVIEGCTDDLYTEYFEIANTDNGSCLTSVVFGCVDSAYTEYNSEANTDDSSCLTLVIEGCTDDLYTEYFEIANTDDGSCLTLVVEGCIDWLYVEYNSDANIDDGSCLTLVVVGCPYSYFLEYDSLYTVADVSMCYNVITDGCTDGNAINYNYAANLDDGSCIVYGCSDPMADNYYENVTIDDGYCIVYGCKNPTAINYITNATEDDGSCIIYGCTFEAFPNYNYLATIDDLSCSPTSDGIYGCTQNLADNYDYLASVNNGSCYTYGCVLTWADNYDSLATINNGYCYRFGCIDDWADNYDPLSTENDYSCYKIGCAEDWADNYDYNATIDDTSCYRLGCTETWADNYDYQATVDDNSCYLYGCPFDFYLEYNLNYTLPDESMCWNFISEGCIDSLATNFDYYANTDDGSCEYNIVYGCANVFACNYDENANTEGECIFALAYLDCEGVCLFDFDDDGVCDQVEQYGCTYEWAMNFNPNATNDDGSCIEVYGCTYVWAFNYDSTATHDDGSCYYEIPLQECEQGFSILLFTGWNLIGYSCDNPINAVIAFAPLIDNLIIAKDNDGNAFLPEWNFNGIGELNSGYGYQLKITDPISNFNICEE